MNKQIQQLLFISALLVFISIPVNSSDKHEKSEQDTRIPGMVYIPAGVFIMGSNNGFSYEFPEHVVNLKEYYIDKYEVTNQQYKFFVDALKYPAPKHWVHNNFLKGEASYPVVNVSYHDASAYAKWSGKRLPTEQEWEKAARYIDGRNYPWGNDWEHNIANIAPVFMWLIKLYPIGSFSKDVSKYGVFDMSGNVREWTGTFFEPYPGNTKPDKNYGGKYMVLRGGSYRTTRIMAQVIRRDAVSLDTAQDDIGFRCAK